MTPQQFRTAIAKLGLSQVAAARFFNVADRKVRRWIAGEYPIDRAVEISLIVMIMHGMKPGDLDKRFRE